MVCDYPCRHPDFGAGLHYCAKYQGRSGTVKRRISRRDDNEAEIVKYWRSLGFVWIPWIAGQGADGLLIMPGKVHIIEIKNPEYNWKLEEDERALMLECHRLGVPYWIIENLIDASDLIDAEMN